jgi:hypothetical protein
MVIRFFAFYRLSCDSVHMSDSTTDTYTSSRDFIEPSWAKEFRPTLFSAVCWESNYLRNPSTNCGDKIYHTAKKTSSVWMCCCFIFEDEYVHPLVNERTVWPRQPVFTHRNLLPCHKTQKNCMTETCRTIRWSSEPSLLIADATYDVGW